MALPDGAELGRFARDHHVHYEVEPEAAADQGDEVVGFQVRLFATHGEQRVEPPACPRCVELLRDLRSFAEQVIAAGAAGRAEIAPSVPATYQSTECPGRTRCRSRCGCTAMRPSTGGARTGASGSFGRGSTRWASPGADANYSRTTLGRDEASPVSS
jgi:hypothetical protein